MTAVAWTAILTLWALWWLLMLAARGIAAWRDSRRESGQRTGQTQAQRYAKQEAAPRDDWDSRSFEDVPVHDVTHGEGGFVSFVLGPRFVVRLENGHFSSPGSSFIEDLTWLREGDRVSGTFSSDGCSLESLRGNMEDRFRYTYLGWAEDITRHSDGSMTFKVVFAANPERVWHPEGREPVTVTLQPGEKVRWRDGRPYRMREGSELTVVFDPDGGPPTIYHETYN